jgi:hypothetical protein
MGVALPSKSNEARKILASNGGDGGELNPPSKYASEPMYYRLSRCFGCRASASHRQDAVAPGSLVSGGA